MSKGGGQTQQQDTTTTNVPWSAQQPHLIRGFNRADLAYNDPVHFPNFPTFAGLTDSMITARDALASRGAGGSVINDTAQDYAINTMQNPGVSGGLNPAGVGAVGRYMDPNYGMDPNQAAGYFSGTPGMDMLAGRAGGDMLGSNPYLDSQYDRAASRVTQNFRDAVVPTINATFGSGGRTGGGLHKSAIGDASERLAENLSGMANNMYGDAYRFDRGLQDQALSQYGNLGMTGRQAAAGMYGADANRALGGTNLWANLYSGDQTNQARAAAMAPTLAGQDYQDIQAQLQAGQIDQAQADAAVADLVNRFQHYETGAGSPQAAVERYINMIQGNYGGTSSTDYQQQPGSTLRNVIGGGISGAAAGSMLGGPFGMIGGILGGLGGLF